MRTAAFPGLACISIARGLAFSALLFALTWSSETLARRPLDRFVRPQPAGTHLRLFSFFGPGVRAILESHVPIEEDMSELRLQAWGDANYGYSQVSAHLDARFFLFALGGSVGYRYEWRSLVFNPSANGRDHGYTSLHREARRKKESVGDAVTDKYPLAEGRLSLFMPMDPLLGISFLTARWEDRQDNSYDWEMSTVYDSGLSYRWETLFPFHHRKWGFLGPIVRVMYVPRTKLGGEQEWETDVHYGFLAGTSPDWISSNDTFLVRIYTTYGLDNDLFGTHTFHAPIQVVVGYQADIDF